MSRQRSNVNKWVRRVAEKFPVMSRRDGSSHIYGRGVRLGVAGVWVMDLTAARKGVVPAKTLANDFELEESYELRRAHFAA